MVEVVCSKKAVGQLERAIRYIKDVPKGWLRQKREILCRDCLNKVLALTRFLNENQKMGSG